MPSNIPGSAPGGKKKKSKPKKNGLTSVHVILAGLGIAFYLVPFDKLAIIERDLTAKMGLVAKFAIATAVVIKGLADQLTITTESLTTFGYAAIALVYLWYSRRKHNGSG